MGDTGLARRHAPALDGFRGLAALAVVLLHANIGVVGGYLGVELFFVLSGFLITTLLLDEFERHDRIDKPRFWARRAIRLVPALIVCVVLAVILEAITGPFDRSSSLLLTVPAALLYAMNWLLVIDPINAGYLSHTWSLAIEEQFYLIWPLLLSLAVVRRNLGKLLWLVGAVLVVRAVATRHVQALDDWTPMQADALLAGAWAADAYRRRTRAVGLCSAPVAWLAAVFVAGAVVALHADSGIRFHGAQTAVAVAGALVILHALGQSPLGAMARLLSFMPLSLLGRVSYGLYLFHFPIFRAVQHQQWRKPQELVVELALTALLTAGSWYFVETPSRRLRESFRSRTSSRAVQAPAG